MLLSAFWYMHSLFSFCPAVCILGLSKTTPRNLLARKLYKHWCIIQIVFADGRLSLISWSSMQREAREVQKKCLLKQKSCRKWVRDRSTFTIVSQEYRTYSRNKKLFAFAFLQSEVYQIQNWNLAQNKVNDSSGNSSRFLATVTVSRLKHFTNSTVSCVNRNQRTKEHTLINPLLYHDTFFLCSPWFLSGRFWRNWNGWQDQVADGL